MAAWVNRTADKQGSKPTATVPAFVRSTGKLSFLPDPENAAERLGEVSDDGSSND